MPSLLYKVKTDLNSQIYGTTNKIIHKYNIENILDIKTKITIKVGNNGEPVDVPTQAQIEEGFLNLNDSYEICCNEDFNIPKHIYTGSDIKELYLQSKLGTLLEPKNITNTIMHMKTIKINLSSNDNGTVIDNIGGIPDDPNDDEPYTPPSNVGSESIAIKFINITVNPNERFVLQLDTVDAIQSIDNLPPTVAFNSVSSQLHGYIFNVNDHMITLNMAGGGKIYIKLKCTPESHYAV